ncbi:leucine/isoleucine/valine transporter ATP-binding subunit [Chania multitudinisentens RB-25]|uniref:Leucine/isoleucine/valine transporter ATP-binding subunit n=1 Tax=Chania multitudinisentens RB-25 TaxID=1441930 RepID=W0LFW5_9GAMM|nr:ABC transporter ATP-binding protein [Chania multitudinisentens]AHG21172.1 leucine/isoleucine/valine transporter ATP-binding subunit [Chania multitudinisentens RB-25]
MLNIEKVRGGYGAINILWDVSLQIQPGTVTAIVGPNGAGKTTLLKTIAGLLPLTQGQISYRNVDIGGLSPWHTNRSGLALIPEGRMIFRDMTVDDNLIMGAFQKASRPHVKSRLQEIYAMFPRLAERQAQLAGVLSGGEAQMLAVGRCLMSDPSMILIDEPSLGLAPVVVNELFACFARLRESGKTILLVEQNTQLSIALADRVCLMRSGKIMFTKMADEIDMEELHRAYFGH